MQRFARLSLSDGRRVFAELEGGSARLLSAAPWDGGTPTDEVVVGVDASGHGEGVRPLAPAAPSKIVCVGRNYADHAKELGNDVPVRPLLFFKPPSSLLDPGGAVELPPPSVSERVEHEVELAVVVGKRLRRATEVECAEAVFGFTIACDVTARDLQKLDGQWARAKGMDTFCPLGPVIVRGLDASNLAIACRVNGVARQEASTHDMVFSVARILAHTAEVMTLEPGDVVLTGTPAGVGPLADGDVLACTIEGIGELVARVVAG